MHLPEATLYRLSGVGLRSSFHVPPPTSPFTPARLPKGGKLEPDFVNPLFQHRHRETLAITCRDCLAFVAQD